jgi:hypothetical protein
MSEEKIKATCPKLLVAPESGKVVAQKPNAMGGLEKEENTSLLPRV